jgi:hypothetical protein
MVTAKKRPVKVRILSKTSGGQRRDNPSLQRINEGKPYSHGTNETEATYIHTDRMRDRLCAH